MQHKLRPTVFLNDNEWQCLTELAEKEQRDPSRQASYMLLLAIRGMTDTKPSETNWMMLAECFRKKGEEFERQYGTGLFDRFWGYLKARYDAGDRSDDLFRRMKELS